MNAATKIERIDIHRLDITRSQPTRTSLGLLAKAQNVAIKITASNGEYGWGEASPYGPITGDSQNSNYVTAQHLARLIKGKNLLAIEARMAEINASTIGEPSIRAAFDIALYDLAAKIADMPLYVFLHGEQRRLRTDLTIGLQESVEDTVAQATAILQAGYDAIKIKVGRPNLEDIKHVTAVRELAGPDIAIKIDTNQGWSYPDAVANIVAMQALALQYAEQPLAAWDIGNLCRLRDRVNLPLCADESVFDHRDALKLVKAGAVDYLNIKLGKSGGIHTALKINAVAEASACQCMIGCFSESRLGLSAAAHLAMARPNIAFLDLDSALKQQEDPVVGGVTYDDKVGGLLHLSDTPGHGAEFDEEFLDEKFHIVI